ncbi:MAG TPA: dipeptidase [Firmicutes bacterium]|nr:dipeptidase [Bacillota bacterium]
MAKVNAGLLESDNQVIRKAWEAGLSILKPTRKELEHGLALHRESLVFESYGFCPRAAVDGEALKAAIEAGATSAELQDLTENMTMTRQADDPLEEKEFKEAWEASGVTAIFQNAGVESQDPMQIIKRLARYTYITDKMRSFLLRATCAADIERAKAEGRHCLFMSANGVPLLQRWNNLEEELGYIKIFYQLGVRMMHLTYNRRNMIGDGCSEPGNAGLSDFGRAVVAEMNRVGVIVDVAHSGWRTSLEAAQVSSRPMVASHSGAAAVNHHIRCKPDEVIKAIADTGGYVGICCIPAFLGRSGDINAFLDHIDYIVKKFGPDHVAIGTDVAYVSRQTVAERKKVPPTRRERPRWEGFWPPGAQEYTYPDQETAATARQSLSWTNWPLFTVGMVQRGHSDETIRKILGGNVLRVVRAAEESR